MKFAIITPCGHFFHAGCLKKWLYVQETCPLCHCQLKNPTQPPGSGLEPVLQANPGADQNTVQQDATETSGVDRQQGGAGGESIDNGQAGKDLSIPKDSSDPRDASADPGAHPGRCISQGEEQEKVVSRDSGGCIQN